MTSFKEILESVSEEQMTASYRGLTLGDFGKEHPEMDNRILSPAEQKFNLAFWAKASREHVGWQSFGAENNAAFEKSVERLYDDIKEPVRQKDFMLNVARTTAPYIQDRHFMLMTGTAHATGGGEKEKPNVGKNIADAKTKPENYTVLAEELTHDSFGNECALWQIGTIRNGAEDILVVSVPRLGADGSYERWQGFIEAFDKTYGENREKWEKGRILLDVRGNGGGEDKPIDHVAKRLYGNMTNSYKRCEINDTKLSNKFLHDHGAYKESNYAKDGLKKDQILVREHFSNRTRTLFDETRTYYPFNEEKGFKGRLDVLIDRGVASSGESAYTSFYHHPNVRYIGENTAGMQQFTQGSFAMPCGYLMRVGVTKLTYWDKEGENIEVKGHAPDVNCSGRDALDVALTMDRDEGRVKGFRALNEPVTGKRVFAEYDPKAPSDPRKAYYAKYLEPALTKLEHENAAKEDRSSLHSTLRKFSQNQKAAVNAAALYRQKSVQR